MNYRNERHLRRGQGRSDFQLEDTGIGCQLNDTGINELRDNSHAETL